MLHKSTFVRIPSVVFGAILAAQSSIVTAQSNQESLSVTPQAIQSFRQISVRVLSAYKTQPRYIGSTDKWHLFLKKETRHAVDKEFSTIFGYKIPTQANSSENGWHLKLPTIEINPDNCPQVSQYRKDKKGFSLPADVTVAARCINK